VGGAENGRRGTKRPCYSTRASPGVGPAIFAVDAYPPAIDAPIDAQSRRRSSADD